MEQDSAKSFSRPRQGQLCLNYLDFNRAGMPFLKIVIEPEIYHPEDGKLAINELYDTLKALGISDANIEEG